MPLPLTVSCFSIIQIGFTFLVPAHPDSPGKKAVKRACVCACVRACVCTCVFYSECQTSVILLLFTSETICYASAGNSYGVVCLSVCVRRCVVPSGVRVCFAFFVAISFTRVLPRHPFYYKSPASSGSLNAGWQRR